MMMMTNSNTNNSSSSIENPPLKKKPTIHLLVLSFIIISLFLLRRYQNEIILITISESDHHRHHKSAGDGNDTCLGRYIYIHNLPSRFNIDIIQDCESSTRPKDKISMCKYLENSGFGPLIGEFTGDASQYSPSWYATNQFMLEVIFHEKMKRYNCLTRNSSLASAIYVPYYAGLDLRRNMQMSDVAGREAAGKDLFKWLKKRPQWKGMSGKDHFLVTGRISRDFRLDSDNKTMRWGTNLMLLPESQNISFLTIERTLTRDNEFAIPYPTYFHPTSASEILQWQDKIKLTNRTILFSFAGAQRPSKNWNGLVRTEVIEQCKNSSKTCRFLDCDAKANNGCDDPISLMKLFESSIFCLQPPGDSLTRRSIFDSMLAGCIPVFFSQGSAYKQYLWHTPKNSTEYSVYIPALRTGGKNKIEEILLRIPNERLIGMRKNVIRLVPKILYTKPNWHKQGGEIIEDAFEVAVKRVLKRIEEWRDK